MTTIFFRTMIIYVILIVTIRLMGKRQIGELQPSELVTTLLLSEIASQPITDSDIPIAYGIIPIIILLALEVIFSFFIMKSQVLKKLFDGVPSIIINNGKLDQKELRKLRISLEELLSELRLKDVNKISEIRYAILERNGKLSVITYEKDSKVTKSDLNLTSDEVGIDHSLIVNGNISDFNLKQMGKSREWLLKQLEKEKISNLNDVFLLCCDDIDGITIIKKEKEK